MHTRHSNTSASRAEKWLSTSEQARRAKAEARRLAAAVSGYNAGTRLDASALARCLGFRIDTALGSSVALNLNAGTLIYDPAYGRAASELQIARGVGRFLVYMADELGDWRDGVRPDESDMQDAIAELCGR